MTNKYKAVLACGGLGTRLKSISGDIPKPLYPILGKNTLERSIEQLSNYGIKNILITLIIQFCKLMNNKKSCPILILDEVVAHLDNKIKKCLFEELKTLDNQVWMSGANAELFLPIINEKEVMNLEIEELIKQ